MRPARVSKPFSCSDSDTTIFGFPVVRARIDTEGQADEAEFYAERQRARLIIARSSTSEIATVQALIRRGYVLVDTLVYLQCNVAKVTKNPRPTSIQIRYATPSEADVVADLARECFWGYNSHYRADPRLDPEKCAEVYATWARRMCENVSPDQVVLLAHEGERLLGFVCLQIDERRVMEGSLAGVSPRAGRAGVYVFRALAFEGTRYSHTQGSKHAFTSTLIQNVNIQRSMIEAGWVPWQSLYTLHKWID